MSIDVFMNGNEAYGHFMIAADYIVLACGLFTRSKTKARAFAGSIGRNKLKWGFMNYHTESRSKWTGLFSPVKMGYDQFIYTLMINNDLNKQYLMTTAEELETDIYNYFMANFKLPLKREWTAYLYEQTIGQGYLKEPRVQRMTANRQENIILMLKGKEVSLAEIKVYEFSDLTEAAFNEIVSKGLREKKICITEKPMKPLEFQSFSDYISNYGASLVANLEKGIEPLMPLKGTVDALALKHKRLYPQQSACVNGIIALKKQGVKYGILNECMGVGKSIQAASVIEAYFVEKYLKENPKKQLTDAYMEGIINYRAIIICPGHICEKWVKEIEEEIPFAKVTMITDFAQLISLRQKGRKAEGREFFVISKEFCKLGTQISPIPTKVRWRFPSLPVCQDCLEEYNKTYYRQGYGKDGECPNCHGRNFKNMKITEYGRLQGLTCPCCDEILLKSRNYSSGLPLENDDASRVTLMPSDFASHKSTNSTCYHCNTPLWGANSKPLVMYGKAPKPSRWYKVTHDKNFSRKSKVSSFVLKEYEDSYYGQCITTSGLEKCAQEYGPRKVSPSHYIKKYLNGFFEFCVLDELHKYEGAGTAQANAAHSLIKVSRFSIGLTGTISNGSAASFFYLLFMLEPKRMLEKGYTWSPEGYMKFCRDYGCIESVFEAARSNEDECYNSNSRGKQIQAPRVKPGISPLLFADFLLDRCVFLDIADLSRHLPPLKEQVVTVRLPDKILGAYNKTMDVLRESIFSPEGKRMLSNILQFGLSYPDKPYGRLDIKSSLLEDVLVAAVSNFEEYETLDNLLPKEEKLVEIVNKELEEGRNCFVFASYTGSSETNITYRLQRIIEKHCNLKGRVEIIHPRSPSASKREQWMHKKAAEGIKVFISNPKCVETGLDFCFTYKGKNYNYPTLIFYQMSYELPVIWQASRRAYRLIQTVECRNYYLAYEGTLQTAALEIMAAKQVATAAIQGKFSTEGLSAMAKGVDTRTQLAASLARNDMSDRKSLENMFDVINYHNNKEGEDIYGEYIQPKTYYELMGTSKEVAGYAPFDSSIFSFDENPAQRWFMNFNLQPENIAYKSAGECRKEEEKVSQIIAAPTETFFDFGESFFQSFLQADADTGFKNEKVAEEERNKKAKNKADSKKVEYMSEQVTVFDYLFEAI